VRRTNAVRAGFNMVRIAAQPVPVATGQAGKIHEKVHVCIEMRLSGGLHQLARILLKRYMKAL
jgi:hypothetical protein